MQLIIRKSTAGDLPRMLEIYAYARQVMKENGNPTQWITYPRRELLAEDIESGCSYVIEAEGKVCGTFAYVVGDDPSYAVIENGAWLDDAPYGTIHRIAGDGTQKGLLAAAVEFALFNLPNLRIDTHDDNQIMQHALAKLGFTKCGIIYCSDDMGEHSPRIAYQKRI